MGSKTKILIPSMIETTSASGLVESLLRVLTLMKTVGEDEMMVEGLVSLCENIFLHSEEAPRRTLVAEAQKNRRLSDFLIARVLPLVAKRLEDCWNEDRLSFVDVTIAATRIQDTVRALGRFLLPTRSPHSVMMIVPAWEQHGLPAAFAAENLRNMGAPTRLISGLGTSTLVNLAARSAPSAIMITVGSYRAMARLPDFISTLRSGIPRAIPIVIGGPGLLGDEAGIRRSGADLATNNLRESLRFCDFPLSDSVNAPSEEYV